MFGGSGHGVGPEGKISAALEETQNSLCHEFSARRPPLPNQGEGLTDPNPPGTRSDVQAPDT